jgi:hypothetical protein
MTWIQTLKGRRFDIANPKAELIDIHEIAVSLSRKCRFGGHTKHFYSVAQHSVIVCDLVDDQKLKLPALLHDAHEAYSGFGDVLSPAKNLSRQAKGFIDFIHFGIDSKIAERFSFNQYWLDNEHIRHADMVALATEKRDLMAACECDWPPMPKPMAAIIEPLGEVAARMLFMQRFSELYNFAT